MTKYNDYPFDDIVKAVQEHAAKGHHCYQKFTCSGCGARLAIDVPNTMHTLGTCDQCGATTDIKKNGCNYLVVIPGGTLGASS
jgi:hypothetical protein